MSREEVNIQDYVSILRKRRWVFLSSFLIVFVTVAAATFLATPVYRASALVYIDPGNNPQVSFLPTQNLTDNPAYLQTQIGILKSDTIAKKVVVRLNLDQRYKDAAGSVFTPAGLLSFIGLRPDSGSVDALNGKVVKRFLDNLEVTAVKGSNLLNVTYEDESAQLAAQVVNTTVQTFIEQSLEMKVAPAREAMSWLNDKLGEIKGRMTESSSQLQDFKQERGLLVTGDKQTNISIQSLSEFNDRVMAAEARRLEAEVKYQQVVKLSRDPDGLMTLPAVMNSLVIQNLKSQMTALSKQVAEQSNKYGEKHPQMIRLKSELDTIKKQLNDEVGLVVASIKNDYDVSSKAEQSLKAALAGQKNEAMSYERRSTEYDIMKQDVEGAKQIYDQVLKKFQESNLLGNISMSNVQFLDRADVPQKPDKPRKALNMLLGLIMGLFTGVGAAFAFEYLDNTFKSPEDIEEHLRLPFLGMVPTNKTLQSKKREDSLVAVSNAKSPFAESFRSIRGSILLAAGDVRPKVIQVCSAVHSEGKSTVSVNLACIMAAAGEKVLLVDGDMRRPRLHKALKVPNTQGLSSLLTRQARMADVLRPTAIPNLHFIPSGPISPNPSELLGSNTMKEAVTQFREQFDRVIIDCPPFLGLADSSMLTPLTDGVLMVVRCGKTPKELVIKTRKSLDVIRAKVLGVVLNDQASKSEDYYYRYNYNYYYGDKKSG